MAKKAAKKKVVQAAREAVEEVDLKVAEAAAPIHKTRAMEFIGTVSEVGDQPQMRVICGTVIAAGLLRGDARLARAGVKMLLAHSIATAAKTAIKHRVDRTRPKVMVEEGRYQAQAGSSREKEESSFPSGHTAGAVAVAGTFAADYPDYRAPAWVAAGAVAAAQVPRCMHYPSDIAAGAVIGLASAAAVNRLMPAESRESD